MPGHMQATEGQGWLMLSQHPAGLPAHTRALISEDRGDVFLQPAPPEFRSRGGDHDMQTGGFAHQMPNGHV